MDKEPGAQGLQRLRAPTAVSPWRRLGGGLDPKWKNLDPSNSNYVLFFSGYVLSVASRGIQNNFIALGRHCRFRTAFSKIASLVFEE